MRADIIALSCFFLQAHGRRTQDVDNSVGLATYLLASNPAVGSQLGRGVRPAVQFPRVSKPQMNVNDYQQVSDVRNKFYLNYGKMFLNIETQGFINEMLTSVSMASGPKFAYSRVFALGFQSLCDTFLAPVPDEADRQKLEDSMITALGLDPATIKKDAKDLEAVATGSTEEALFETEDFKQIAATEEFKYVYQFGAGLLRLMDLVGQEPTEEAIERWCGELNISNATLKKDAAYYKSIIKKLAEMKQMRVQMEASAKRKEAAKLQEEAARAAKEAEKAEKAAA